MKNWRNQYGVVQYHPGGRRGKADEVRPMPKPLQKAAGKALVDWVLDAAEGAGTDENIVVIGHQAEEIREYLGQRVTYTYQYEQLGTGHAVIQGIEPIRDQEGTVMVLYGDAPLIQADTLRAAMDCHLEEGRAATVITAQVDDPYGYGRIVRQAGKMTHIVEEKDASEAERAIREINSGMYLFAVQKLVSALGRLNNDNAQGEYYLTDVISILLAGRRACGHLCGGCGGDPGGQRPRISWPRPTECSMPGRCGSLCWRAYACWIPASVRADADVKVGRDTVIYPGTILEGAPKLAKTASSAPTPG